MTRAGQLAWHPTSAGTIAIAARARVLFIRTQILAEKKVDMDVSSQYDALPDGCSVCHFDDAVTAVSLTQNGQLMGVGTSTGRVSR